MTDGADGERRALRLLVSGRVQGVGFRYFVWRQAEELGLAGTVANLPDGRVEARAAGDPASLAEFTRRLRQGPPAARVAAVDVEELAADPGWRDFRVTG
jgi:acylphosphatase